MRRYEKYKATDISTIGDIPIHWKVSKLKYLIGINSGDGIKPDEIDFDGSFPVYGGNGIMGYTERFNSETTDIIIGRVGAKCGNVRLIAGKKWVSDNALVAHVKGENDLRFVSLLLDALNLNALANQNAQPLITGTLVKEKLAAIPPIKEQTAIANYLDEKTAQIDTLIEKKQKLIELLKEERKAIINEAVSGEGKNWERKKLKYYLDCYDHLRIPLNADERGRVEKIYDYYGASGIIDKVDKYIFDGEYILLGEDGANLLARSSPLAFKATGKFWVNNHAHILKPKTGNIDFFMHLLESIDYSIWVSGSAQPKLTAENLLNIYLSAPGEKEQTRIVSILTTEIGKIDATIRELDKEIELINEYKTALISEVVTGKVKVI